VDGDCQNARHELLIATSKTPVQFKNSKRCTFRQSQWYSVYTGQTFTKASDVDIDHVVPLAHAHRHGTATWARSQGKTFANDFDDLLIVNDATNQSKSDKAPHEWLPPLEDY
jgi:CRISPR/Cas system Type II protein with McrA/HNH and RuvC-like nuclease domain